MTQTEGGRTAKRAMQKKDLSVCRSGPARQGPNDMPPPAPPGRGHPGGIHGGDSHASNCSPAGRSRALVGPVLCWCRGLPITAFPHQSTSRHGQFSPVEASALPAPPQQSRWWSSSAFRVPNCFPNDDQLLLPQLRPLPPGLATRRMSLLLVTVLNDTAAARRLAS